MSAGTSISLKERTVALLARASGVYSSGQGLAAAEEGLGGVLLIALLGAFVGLLAGILVTHIVRFVSMLAGRSPGGYSWAIYGAVLGAILFGCLAAVDRDE
jgi:hypothetical protein